MRASTWVWVVLVLIILGGGWYLWMRSPVPAPAQQSAQTTQATQASSSQVQPTDGSYIADNLTLGTDSNAALGTYLIAYNGMTLYTYDKDSTGTSTCYGACAANWPPYIVPAGMHLNLEAGVSAAASVIQRADGQSQVTYKGMPLYFYVGDTQGEDTKGNGTGGVWHVVKP